MSKLESDMARLDKKLKSSGRKTKGNWGFGGLFKSRKSRDAEERRRNGGLTNRARKRLNKIYDSGRNIY